MSRSRNAVAATIVGAALAFTGCTEGEPQPLPTPEKDASGSEIGAVATDGFTVGVSTFLVSYRLDGMVEASSRVGLDVPVGTELVPDPLVSGAVEAGTRLGVLRAAAPPMEVKGTVGVSQARLLQERLGPVTAPIAGVPQVSRHAASVEVAGLDVVVPLRPLQELRYRSLRFTGEASIETVLGQRTAPCVAIWIESTHNGGTTEDGPSAATVHCRLPVAIETVPDLPAVLTLTSERVDGVVAVPLVYLGLSDSGEDYIARLREGDSIVEQPVVVGSTDGVRRIVLDGLEPGHILAPFEQR